MDVVLPCLAKQFPNIEFISVDLQDNLERINNKLIDQPENRRFLSGYVIDLLKTQQLKVDLLYMQSTSILFNNRELDVFLEECSQSTKLLILNEPWGAKINSCAVRIIRPEDIPKDDPYCGGGLCKLPS